MVPAACQWSRPLGERFGGCGPEARAPIAAGQLETGDSPGQLGTGDSPGQLETDERNAWARAAAES
jgi:hypothetical protein